MMQLKFFNKFYLKKEKEIAYLLSISISFRKSLHTGVGAPSDNNFIISLDNSRLLLLKNSDVFSFPIQLGLDRICDNSELPE